MMMTMICVENEARKGKAMIVENDRNFVCSTKTKNFDVSLSFGLSVRKEAGRRWGTVLVPVAYQ
jgi:hypothetical protein